MSALRRPSSNDVLKQWRRKTAQEEGHRHQETTRLTPTSSTDRVADERMGGGWLDQFGKFLFGSDAPSPPTRMDCPSSHPPTAAPTTTPRVVRGDLVSNVPSSPLSPSSSRRRGSVPGAAIPTASKRRKHRSFHPPHNVSQHLIDPRQSSEHLARKQILVKYPMERESKGSSKQEQPKRRRRMTPELQRDMRKGPPTNDGQYDYYANGNDNDNHQGNVDNEKRTMSTFTFDCENRNLCGTMHRRPAPPRRRCVSPPTPLVTTQM